LDSGAQTRAACWRSFEAMLFDAGADQILVADFQSGNGEVANPSLEQVHASGDRLGQAGGGSIKETEDQPHALAITIGENTSEQRKTGGRHSRGNQPGTPRKTAKLAHSGGITASKGARLAMVGFRLDAPCLC